MSNSAFSKPSLDRRRRRYYGTGATLKFIRLKADAAPELLATLTDATGGWYLQRQGYTKGNEDAAKQSLLHLVKSAIAEATLHKASRVELFANSETFTFTIADKAPSQALGKGYLIPLTQINPTTD